MPLLPSPTFHDLLAVVCCAERLFAEMITKKNKEHAKKETFS
jgi:hypothetical protein